MRLWMDCDPGLGTPGTDVDDALALAIALQAEDTHVEGIVISAGNVSLTDGLRNANRMLRLAGRPEIPLVHGLPHPLLRDESHWRNKLNGWRSSPKATALWEHFSRHVAELDNKLEGPESEDLISFINRLSFRAEPVTVVATAPLTNVALALTASDRLRDHVERIVLMGGAVSVPGVHTEFNFSFDPEAAAIVLRLRVPITIVPLDITRSLAIAETDLSEVAAAGARLGSYIAQGAQPWARFFTNDDCPPTLIAHDALATLIAMDPALAHTVPSHARVELHGSSTSGQLLAWPQDHQPEHVDHPACDCCMFQPGSVEIVDEANLEEARARIMEALKAG